MPYRVAVLFTYFICFLNIRQYANQVFAADDFSGWKAGNYPDPVLDPEACGLPVVVVDNDDAGIIDSGNYTSFGNASFTSWLCDPDGVLYEHELYDLLDLLNECRQSSPCECSDNCTESAGGYNIAIAVVDRLNTDGDFQPMKVKAKIFADEVRERWFENQSCGDSVLIFYTWHANKLSFSLGHQAAKVISDIELAALFEIGKKHLVRKPKNYEYEDDWSTETNTTTTYVGMDALVRQVHAGIMNGSSITSRMLFSITVPLLLLLTIIIMCLISNCWCPQDFLYDPTADKNTINRMLR